MLWLLPFFFLFARKLLLHNKRHKFSLLKLYYVINSFNLYVLVFMLKYYILMLEVGNPLFEAGPAFVDFIDVLSSLLA